MARARCASPTTAPRRANAPDDASAAPVGGGGSRTKLPKSISDKIHKVSDTEFNVERSVLEEVLEKQASLMRGVRLRPRKNGSDVMGLQVSRVRRGTLLNEVGLKNGDVIKGINGFDLTDPQKALEAYGRLRTASELELSLVRNGKPTSIEFHIQ